MIRRACVGAVLMALACAAPAAAQQGDPPPMRRVEAAVGVGVMSGASAGSGDATLRGSGPNGQPFRLFSTESQIQSSPMFDLRAGLALSRRFGVEVRFARNQPELRTSISNDFEGAPSLEVGEQLDQYVVDASFVVMPPRFRVFGLTPFVLGGGGYLRQLHEGATLIEEGRVMHVGGGVRRWLLARNSGLVKGLGLRGDLRVNVLSGGIAEEEARVHPSASASVVVGF